jgi:hypothetical protein
VSSNVEAGKGKKEFDAVRCTVERNLTVVSERTFIMGVG